MCYIDEKEVNLREIALEPVYPTDPGDVTVKGNVSLLCVWFILYSMWLEDAVFQL